MFDPCRAAGSRLQACRPLRATARQCPQSVACSLSPIASSLPLLVLLIGANHAHDAFAPDNLALVTHPLDRRSHLHDITVSSIIASARRSVPDPRPWARARRARGLP